MSEPTSIILDVARATCFMIAVVASAAFWGWLLVGGMPIERAYPAVIGALAIFMVMAAIFVLVVIIAR
jgi:hypothetical protein